MRIKGLGLGWRRETAWLIEGRKDLAFVEIVAEQFDPGRPLPVPIQQLLDRGMPVIPHGIGLSVGDAGGVDSERLDTLCALTERLNAPLVSEHVTFVRAGDLESGHLLPLPRTDEMLDILDENIRIVMNALPAPLALENIATLFEWPDNAMDEGAFLSALHERTGVGLLIDVANLYANAVNHGWDAHAILDALPIDAIDYVHLAGGHWRDGVYFDTHADPLPVEPIALLAALVARGYRGGAMLERDDHFDSSGSIHAELDAIRDALTSSEFRDVG